MNLAFGEKLYTFTGKMIGQQLKSDSTLSEFSNLIIKSGLAGLLNSYGAYTCFTPDNQAMYVFYAQNGRDLLMISVATH